MSIEAHPNIHAVKLAVGLMSIVYEHHGVPREPVIALYKECLRGKATADTDVDLDGMIESLQVLVKDRLDHDDRESIQHFIVRFGVEISERLDTAVGT